MAEVIEGSGCFEKNVYLVDLEIGGVQGQNVYVLNKKEGVAQVRVWEKASGEVWVEKNAELGVVRVENGIKMAQYNDESLVVLQKVSEQRHRVIDFSIDVGKDAWFVLNEYAIHGVATDIDITRSFFVVRGVDSHQVLFHSIYKEFAVRSNARIEYHSPS